MPYHTVEVVLIDVKGISPALLRDFLEFLRLNMIVPIRPISESDGESQDAHFNGSFVKTDAERAEKWLKENNVLYKQPKED